MSFSRRVPAQVAGSLASPRAQLRDRAGIAIVTVLVTISVIGLLVASIWTPVNAEQRAERSRQDAVRARHLAESGFAHAFQALKQQIPAVSVNALLQGADGIAGTADDGLLANHSGLANAVQVPAGGRSYGGGTYYVRLLDDPNDTQAGGTSDDGQGRFVLSCRAELPGGATAEVRALMRRTVAGAPAGPALHLDAGVEISGKLRIEGTCGRGHVNGTFTGGGEPYSQVEWSSTGTPIPSSFQGVKKPGSPALPVDIATNVLSYCTGPNVVYITNSLWKPKENNLQKWKTYCVTGNVEFDAEFGSTTNHRMLTVIATGSIKMAKKLWFEAYQPDGIVLLAGGDLDIQAEAGLKGRVMCGSQLYISDKPLFEGTVTCANRANPAGSQNWVPANLISGDAKIIYPCPASGGSGGSGITERLSWYPVIGT